MEVHQKLNPNQKNGYATSDLKMVTPTSDLIIETLTPIEIVVAKKRQLSGDLIALGVTKNQARYVALHRPSSLLGALARTFTL